ncbi:MAG TPA: Hsp20/alpha crystallin family protein [Cyclobacteriaceae bacterium]|nr:Hsp20/alpha crystallin family protein [Cyclobacteriaceae bacterium]
MNLTKRNSFLPSSTALFDDFFTRDLFDWSKTEGNGLVPRVNIKETDDGFAVEIAAPGMKKEDFHVELDNDMLTVSSESSENREEEKSNYTRKEFSYHAFRRSFYLPNTVDAEQINGKYTDGILSLWIPKKEEAKKKPARMISIN